MKKEKPSLSSTEHIGANIRAIRIRQHLSQVELARRLDMRPGPLNCIEKGRNLPGARVLHSLSQILKVPVDAFFTTPYAIDRDFGASGMVREESTPYMSLDGKPAWEGPCAMPARTFDEQAEYSEDLCVMAGALADAFLELEDICGAVKSAELPLNLSVDRTEAGLHGLCSRVRRLLGISDAVIFDYLELFENAGLRIIFCQLPSGVESISCHDLKNSNAFIFIDDGSKNAERQLFRLAYELGRLYMHAPVYLPHLPRPAVGRNRRGKLFIEDRAARRFAGLFLMPESTVCATVRQLGVKPDEWSLELLYRIKNRFGVSAQAFLIRLNELRLISPRLEKAHMAEIQKFYDAHDYKEPGSSRRVLTPNGRLWDLMLTAGRQSKHADELRRLANLLEKYGVKKV